MGHIRNPEAFELGRHHRQEVDDALSTRQAVAKLAGGGQGGRAGRQQSKARKLVSRNFQDPARIRKLMDLVEHDDPSIDGAKKTLWICQPLGG
jgi:hypothetical protein